MKSNNLNSYIITVLSTTLLGWAAGPVEPSVCVRVDSSSTDSNDMSYRYFLDKDSKSSWHAFLIAFFPGFIIHGLGHHYADHHIEGFGLTGVEIAGYLLFIKNLNWIGGSHGGNDDLALTGLGLFFGSWVFDFVRAPMLVEKANRRKQNARLGDVFINLEPTAVGIKLNLVKSF